MPFRPTLAVLAAAALLAAGSLRAADTTPTTPAPATPTGDANASNAAPVRVANPYARIAWDKVEYLHSCSHQHGRNPQMFYDMGFRHMTLTNYYPSKPFYPLPTTFAQKHPDAVAGPNAEQHSTTDSGVHFCVVGGLYATGYGHEVKIKPGTTPVEHVFTGINAFRADRSPWLGIYRLDVLFVAQPGATEKPSVRLTVEGAVPVHDPSFKPVEGGPLTNQRLTASSPESRYLRADADKIRVRLEFDPAVTKITRCRLMQGTNRPWRDAFRAALDGTLKDAAGRPIEGLLFPDAGGITLNHPEEPLAALTEKLDFDPRVLGIEVWNQHERFGRADMKYYRRWDEILRTGRSCFGFFVKDHVAKGCGRNVLLVDRTPGRTPAEREREALLAYREGRFFGLLGALTVNEAGQSVSPCDYTEFRFTRIAVRENASHEPIGLEAAVDGADRTKRPSVQLRFITDAGTALVVNARQGYYAFPRDASGKIGCRYVRVEAFAYPRTHLDGKPLTAEALTSMNVHEISQLHDRRGDIMPGVVDPPGRSPMPIVDMAFSQAIRFGDRDK